MNSTNKRDVSTLMKEARETRRTEREVLLISLILHMIAFFGFALYQVRIDREVKESISVFPVPPVPPVRIDKPLPEPEPEDSEGATQLQTLPEPEVDEVKRETEVIPDPIQPPDRHTTAESNVPEPVPPIEPDRRHKNYTNWEDSLTDFAPPPIVRNHNRNFASGMGTSGLTGTISPIPIPRHRIATESSNTRIGGLLGGLYSPAITQPEGWIEDSSLSELLNREDIQPRSPEIYEFQRVIVFLRILVSPDGKPEDIKVSEIRTEPECPADQSERVETAYREAAMEAARQFEFKPTRIGKEGVRREVKVAITFDCKRSGISTWWM